MIVWWPLLLPAAASSGFWFARRQLSMKIDTKKQLLSREYVVGLNYLLNEQPDKAVDLFIKLLEVDSDTVETHLALGSLFRRRGEFDRAIRIHQNLIARPKLSVIQRKEALVALGQDYMSAGVFDRAERIFTEVSELSGHHEVASLQGLLAIYQQEKAWEKALEILHQLEAMTGTKMSSKAGHFYCEIAERHIKNQSNHDKAYQAIKHALNTDKFSVRANLMFARLEMKHGRFKQAIRALKAVPEQDVDFLTEIIEPLMICYREIDAMDECIDYLEQTLYEHPSAGVIFEIGEYLQKEKGLDLAIDFVSTHLSRYPSIRGLTRLINWYLETTHGQVRDKLQMLHRITSKFLEDKPVYRCSHCGFGGKLLHWICPGCKQWGKVKPIHGLEGD